MWRFYYGVGIIVVLVVYLPLTSALVAFLGLSLHQRTAIAIGAIVLTCMLLGMALPLSWLDRRTTTKTEVTLAAEALVAERRRHSAESDGKEGAVAVGNVEVAEPISDGIEATHSNSSVDAAAQQGTAVPVASPLMLEIATDVDYIAPQYQTSFWQNLCTLQLWSILWTMFCGVGAEFVIIFNARFLYGALNGAAPDDTVGALLTVINGVGSAVGRLAMSYFEVWTQNKKAEDRMPITISFFVPTWCIIISIVLFLVLPGRWLLLAFTVASLGNGFCASVTILALRTIYAKDPAKHYNFGYNALWIAAILLNRVLFGEYYAVQADKLGVKVCYSRVCVQTPLIVMLALNVTAFVSNVYLHIVYSRFSRRVLDERAAVKRQCLQQAAAATEEQEVKL
ncbi:hypothetical protein STCU_06902 [Strigomonas culicis]|uniref:Nodulin-like domain-containing protein n=1 Tax=Strigomonas culicis TaxID=28005 RepID=S9VDB3_9TRYP|nr:hypothetical protein STCU_06902 [Strigomonas culicis]|eukprot:EPY24991.1 hypothetical protein STCU_06902 [Strigomonas culicis]